QQPHGLVAARTELFVRHPLVYVACSCWRTQGSVFGRRHHAICYRDPQWREHPCDRRSWRLLSRRIDRSRVRRKGRRIDTRIGRAGESCHAGRSGSHVYCFGNGETNCGSPGKCTRSVRLRQLGRSSDHRRGSRFLMRMLRRFGWVLMLFAVVHAFGRAQQEDLVSAAIDVQTSGLEARPPSANWVSYNGDYTGRRYSSLSEINTSNVANLRAQWVFHSRNSSRLEVTPVVVNGMMFVTSANDAFALDARTGRVVWHHARPISEGLIDDAS